LRYRKKFRIFSLLLAAVLLSCSGSSTRIRNYAGQNLTGQNFQSADLARADLHNCNLSSCNLKGANLMSANLTGADLTGADLRSAMLYGAIFQDNSPAGKSAILQDADLTGAIIERKWEKFLKSQRAKSCDSIVWMD